MQATVLCGRIKQVVKEGRENETKYKISFTLIEIFTIRAIF